MRFTVLMPWPPSVNAAYRNGSKGRHKTKAYRNWEVEAGGRILLKPTTFNSCDLPMTGAVSVEMQMSPPDKREKRDLSNFIKVPEDQLVRWRVIEDDSQVKRLLVTEDRENVSPGNILVTVEEL